VKRLIRLLRLTKRFFLGPGDKFETEAGYRRRFLVSPACVLLATVAWIAMSKWVTPGVLAPEPANLTSTTAPQPNSVAIQQLKANGASGVWRASLLGLFVCMIVYSAIGIRSRALVKDIRDGAASQRSEVLTPGLRRAILWAVPLLVAACFGWLTSAYLPPDARVQVLNAAVDDNSLQAITVPSLMISFIWASAGYMIVAGVYWSWNTSAAAQRIDRLHESDPKAYQGLQRIARYLNWMLVIGAVGPVVGVIEVISLAHLAAALIDADDSVRGALIANGHGNALEIGFLFTMIQISLYVPAYIICQRKAASLVTAHLADKVADEETDHPSLESHLGSFEAIMTRIGFPPQTQSSIAARATAIASPVIAAVGSNLIDVPSF
jgi:hypothetical protein